MKEPRPKSAKTSKSKTPPPPPPENGDEPLGPEDFLEMRPLELLQNMIDLLRGGNGEISAETMKGMLFQRLDALHQLMTITADPSLLTPVQRLTMDLKNAARTLGPIQARFLVDAYYTMQENRIRSDHQIRTLAEPKATGEISDGEEKKVPEPSDVLEWVLTQEETLEKQIRSALNYYSLSNRAGVWAQSIKGIGPVIAAGLLANIDIEKAPTVGHIWRFAGLDPTSIWGKGEKRPWNASLKRLCWLLGESFVKVSNRPDDVYGKLYKQRKEWETERNSRQLYADQAAAALEAKKFGKSTEAFKWYSQGMLPPARIHLRATRRATKIFLSHLHEVMYWLHYRKMPPNPFVFDRMPGHVHRLEIPNIDIVDGLEEARAAAHRAQRGRS
jgi:hypothetical protein